MTKKQIAAITKLVDEILEQRGLLKKSSLHPDAEKISGMIPKEIDARKEHDEHLAQKHK